MLALSTLILAEAAVERALLEWAHDDTEMVAVPRTL